jgi:hypothetical protein
VQARAHVAMEQPADGACLNAWRSSTRPLKRCREKTNVSSCAPAGNQEARALADVECVPLANLPFADEKALNSLYHYWWRKQEGFYKTLGAFELKEHLSSIGLGLLPFYWYLWKNAANTTYASTRKWVTIVLAAICWYTFLAGHIVNNVRGFGL